MRGQLICLLPIKTAWGSEKLRLQKYLQEIQADIATTFLWSCALVLVLPKRIFSFSVAKVNRRPARPLKWHFLLVTQRLVFWDDDLGIYKLLSLINNNPDAGAFINEQLRLFWHWTEKTAAAAF